MEIQSKKNTPIKSGQSPLENMLNPDRNGVQQIGGTQAINLTPLQLRQHYLPQAKFSTKFSEKKQIEKELKDVFLATKDADNKTFLNKIYPVFLKYYELEDIAPKKIKILEGDSSSGQAGGFLETTGEPFIYKNYLKSSTKKKIAATLAHELKHLKQFSIIYKNLGKDNFTSMACNDLGILKFYSKFYNLNSYTDTDKIFTKIKDDINNSKVYKKVEKLPKLTKEEQKLAIKYIEANSAYRASADDYEAYKSNLLEKEAFAEDKAMEDLYVKLVEEKPAIKSDSGKDFRIKAKK